MILRGLSAIGSLGSRAIAFSLILGIAVPPLSALMKPLFPVAVFFLLTAAMVRMDMAAARGVAARPLMLTLAILWSMIAVPFIGTGLVALTGLPDVDEGLALAIAMQMAAPPIMSVPAFCFMLGLNGTLALIMIALSLLVAPITAPLASAILLGEALPIAPWSMALRLALYLAGALALALVFRRLVGPGWVARNNAAIDGFNVVILFVFAVAIMDGVAVEAINRPLLVIALVILSFMIACGIIATTWLAFYRLGNRDSLALGLSAGNRNMGLMASVLVAGLPDSAWLYFGLAQFPIYFLPWMMGPLTRRVLKPPRAAV
ncbi:MAG: sodium:proton symporter [Pseudomonadota bacterium]